VSQENVDNYRRSIALWNSGDLDGLLALAATEPDSEFRTSGMFPGVERVYRGVLIRTRSARRAEGKLGQCRRTSRSCGA
jgi:ketosteroid isomerase-like protein